jgi:hypothetical protein
LRCHLLADLDLAVLGEPAAIGVGKCAPERRGIEVLALRRRPSCSP